MARKLNKKTEGRAVIYARYSSHNQRDVSIEQQYAACEAFAAQNGLTVVEHYADRAISGKTDKRPAFQRMMKAAQNGGFDFVIAWKSNRMGRIIQPLKKLKICPPPGRLTFFVLKRIVIT